MLKVFDVDLRNFIKGEKLINPLFSRGRIKSRWPVISLQPWQSSLSLVKASLYKTDSPARVEMWLLSSASSFLSDINWVRLGTAFLPFVQEICTKELIALKCSIFNFCLCWQTNFQKVSMFYLKPGQDFFFVSALFS